MFNDQTSVETLEIMQATNLKSGCTSFLPTFITAPDEDIKRAVNIMREYLNKHKNQALGLHIEGPYLSLEKRGVHRPEYIREATPEMKDFYAIMRMSSPNATIAAENPTVQYIPDFVKAGIVCLLVILMRLMKWRKLPFIKVQPLRLTYTMPCRRSAQDVRWA